jgi:phytoene dehydrogenase-like protein
MVRKLMTSYGALVKQTFRHEGLRAAMAWLAAQSGPPPTAAATGDFLGWHSMIHKSGVKRPRGGSGALTQAMARCLKSHGGEVLLNAEVEKIEVSNNETGGHFGQRSEHKHLVEIHLDVHYVAA